MEIYIGFDGNIKDYSKMEVSSKRASEKHPSSPKMLSSTYTLNRQYSSPSVLPSTPTTANLTARNTNASIVSPDLTNMSIPLLSTKPHADNTLKMNLRSNHSLNNMHQLSRTHQYQPSRDNSFSEFGIVEPEDLSIFIDDQEHSQLSIPSIRLANHLADTDCDDDSTNRNLLDTSIDTISTINDDDDYHDVQILLKDDPYEWLQQMRADGIVEAASSKFLTRDCHSVSNHTI